MTDLILRADVPAELPVHANPVHIVRADGWGEVIATVESEFVTPEEVNRRALLLAAAPELLAALQAALKADQTAPGWGGRWIEQAQAAIAKATGGAANVGR